MDKPNDVENYYGYNTSHLWLYVEKVEDGIQGAMLSPCFSAPIPFQHIGEFILKANQLFDRINFPQRAMAARSIDGRGLPTQEWIEAGLRPPVSSEAMSRQLTQWTGPLALHFCIYVHFRRNASWQGELHLIESRRKVCFRSALELMELIMDAVRKQHVRVRRNSAVKLGG